jgi:hypothetical protein
MSNFNGSPKLYIALLQLREQTVAVTNLHVGTTSKVKLPFMYTK